MSTNMPTQSIFAREIFLRILSYSDPEDIVQWHTVSKWFQTITCDTALWRALYKKASFPLPPGPFPTQTHTSLERTLVRSKQQNWTWGAVLRIASYKEISFQGKTSGHATGYDLIGGRWLVACQSQQRFVLFDADAEVPEPQTLWEQEGEITFWSYCAMVSKEGQFVVYVRFREEHAMHDKLVEFRLDGESGALCDTDVFDIPNPDRGQVIGGPSSPFIRILPHLLFDTQTHCFCKLPEFCIALDEIQDKISRIGRHYTRQDVVFTRTHVLVISHYSSWLGETCLVQAFAWPVDKNQSLDEDGLVILTQTHEEVFSAGGSKEDEAMPVKPDGILQNSTVDLISGSTEIVLICEWSSTGGYGCSLVCVTLDAPSPTGIASIATDWYPFIVDGRSPKEKDRTTHNFMGLLDGGHSRGIQIDAHNHSLQGEVFIAKFYIDFQEMTRVYMDPFESLSTRLEGWTDSLHWSGEFKSFDGMSGRLCYGWSDTKGSDHVAIIGLR